MGRNVVGLHDARAKRADADIEEIIRTGVAAFNLLERGAKALVVMTAGAAETAAAIKQAARRSDRPQMFAAVDAAARNAAAALRDLGDLAQALERIASGE